MRLAFCLLRYYPYGGLERDFLRIVKVCLAAGHSVKVYTMKWQGEIPENLSITYIPVSGMTNHGRVKKYAQKVLSFFSKEKFDCIIGFNRLPGLDIYFAADPCYQSETFKKHGALYRLLSRYRIYKNLESAVFSEESKTKILLLNPSHKKEFIKYYKTQDARFIHLKPGIAEDRKRPANQKILRSAVREEAHVKDDEKIILMVGSDFKRKGVDRALNAFDSLPISIQNKTHLWIVGKGECSKLKVSDRVKFWGPREDIVRFYAAADCFLHPAYQETAGMVLIESIEAGLPIIVTENCGYSTYIKEANSGIIIKDPFHQSELNQKLCKLLSDDKLLKNYHQNALDYAKNQDLFRMSENVLEIIENVCKK
jgi:UDP-glucose:(heptosyl)LPS alpha-1,3-glucosyltransferase